MLCRISLCFYLFFIPQWFIIVRLRYNLIIISSFLIYRVSQKKRNGGFSVPCWPKISYFLTSLDKTSSAEENDTKIVKFGWVILNLCTFLETQSISNFAGFLGPMSEEFCRDKQSIRCPVEAHCSVFRLLPRINGLPQNTIMEGLSRHNSSLTGSKNPAKFENDSISRNGHIIEITQPNLMI